MKTDTSEKGLETLIVKGMIDRGWLVSDSADYDRDYAVDLKQLTAFLTSTQPDICEPLELLNDSPTRQKFLARLQGEISKRGVIDVLRHGIKHGAHHIELFYGTPSLGNVKAAARSEQNRFTVTRQLRYSRDETGILDLGLFLNGLTIATFELKNSLTKQTVADAEEQYKRDRDPRERLFELGRCIAHFAVDDAEVRFCTHLKGKASWFLPCNQGYNDGAGNPPNPDGLKTDYLWKRILTPQGLTDILENYAQIVEIRSGLALARSHGKRLGPPRVSVDCAQIATLRRDGRSWSEICETLGVSKGTAQRAVLSLPKNLAEIAVANS